MTDAFQKILADAYQAECAAAHVQVIEAPELEALLVRFFEAGSRAAVAALKTAEQ